MDARVRFFSGFFIVILFKAMYTYNVYVCTYVQCTLYIYFVYIVDIFKEFKANRARGQTERGYSSENSNQ